MRKSITTIAAFVIAAAMFQVEPVLGSVSKAGKVVAYAKVDSVFGTVLSFGGNRTRTASAVVDVSGYQTTITFTGRYPSSITPDKVIINSTCNSTGFIVSNASVVSVSPTTLVIRVYNWASNTTNIGNGIVFVSVFIGKTP